jgi:hypothetical protein
MTGLEHYELAEVAQQAAAAIQANRQPGPDATATEALLDAQVHATLALVWAHNRTQTELNNLLHTMLDRIRDLCAVEAS